MSHHLRPTDQAPTSHTQSLDPRSMLDPPPGGYYAGESHRFHLHILPAENFHFFDIGRIKYVGNPA
jgi:hypothetical protein